MSQANVRELEVKLFSNNEFVKLEVSPMNTMSQIIQMLTEEQFIDKNIPLSQFRFVDGTLQELSLQDQTRKIRTNNEIYELLVTLKNSKVYSSSLGDQPQEYISEISSVQKSTVNLKQNHKLQQKFNKQKEQVDEDCIYQAIEATYQGKQDFLNNINEERKISKRIYILLAKIIEIVINNNKAELIHKQNTDMINLLKNQIIKQKQAHNREIASLKNPLKIDDQPKKIVDMEKQRFRKNNLQLSQKVKQLEERLIQANSQTKKAITQINQFQVKIQKAKANQIQLNKDIQKLKKQFQVKIQKAKANQIQLNKDIQKLKKQLQLSKMQNIQQSRETNFSKILMKIKPANKQFIFEAIRALEQLQIASDELIYKYDPINKANFHNYIDQKSHLLFVIETISGKIIGAYTQGAFRTGFSGSKSFLFTLKDKKIFQLREISNKKAIQYDPFFIIFGNQQLTLQHNSNKIRVGNNLGFQKGYFAINRVEVDQFLSEQRPKTQVELKSYEVYQITLSNKIYKQK